jgi:imidazolonepropionase-like amidohydrolase
MASLGSTSTNLSALAAIAGVFYVSLVLPLAGQAKSPPATASGAPIAIVGGKLLTVTHGVIENGVIVLVGGKISAVGAAGSVKVPAGATIVDAKAMTTDTNEPSDEIMPHMHVYDAFHAETTHIPIARYNGVTNAIVAPGIKDSVSGQDMLIQLSGKDRDDMILSKDIALAVNFGTAERRDLPKYPSTRMGLITQLRQSMMDTQEYKNKKDAAAKKSGTAFKTDLRYEALLPYLAGQRPVVIGVVEAHDVEPIMAVAQEFHLKVILNHLSHAQDVLDQIAAYKVPVIFSSIWELPDAGERFDVVYATPGEMVKRGIQVAIATDNAQKDRNLPYAAGYAVAYGMPYDAALRSITLTPAEMFGVGDQYGSLDVGKVANGDPMDVRTDVKQVYIDGEAMPMVTRQTVLRDAYSK